jgi:hypothetical protein
MMANFFCQPLYYRGQNTYIGHTSNVNQVLMSIHEKLGQQNVVVMSNFQKCCSVTFLRTLF